MTGAMEGYRNALLAKLDELWAAEGAALERAADLCAESLANTGVIHIYDTGHLISHEFIARTGGLVAYSRLNLVEPSEVNSIWRSRQIAEGQATVSGLDAERGLVDWLVAKAVLKAGDVLIIGSVSGTGTRPVELALRAREHGLKVIAITAPAFSAQLKSSHPSGKRLFEAGDVLLDNHAPYGDSFLKVPGLETLICPVSGVSAAVLMWTLTAGIVERLVSRGLQPSVFRSINLPDGPTLVQEVESRYRERGL